MTKRNPNFRLWFFRKRSSRHLVAAALVVLITAQGCSLQQVAVKQVETLAGNSSSSNSQPYRQQSSSVPGTNPVIDSNVQPAVAGETNYETLSNAAGGSDVAAFQAAMASFDSKLSDENDPITEEFINSTFNPDLDTDEPYRTQIQQAAFQESVSQVQNAGYQESSNGNQPGMQASAGGSPQQSGATFGDSILPLQNTEVAVPNILAHPAPATTRGRSMSSPSEPIHGQVMPGQPGFQGQEMRATTPHAAHQYQHSEGGVYPQHRLPTRSGSAHSQPAHQLTDQYSNQHIVINQSGGGLPMQFSDPMGHQPSERGLLNIVGSEYRQPAATASEIMIAQREDLVQLQAQVGTLKTELVNERARFAEEQTMRREAEQALAKTQNENERLRAMVARLQVQVEQIEKARQDLEVGFNAKLREIETSLDSAVMQTLENIPQGGKPKR